MRNFEINLHSKKSLIIAGGAIAVLGIGLYVAAAQAPGIQQIKEHMPPSSETSDSPSNSENTSAPAMHKDIIATVFWVGEAASEENDFIQNRSSAWQNDWMGHFGGEDTPDDRCGNVPCAFIPKENYFYFALPFNDLQENGQPKPANVLKNIPWYNGQPKPGTTLLKNRWVEVTRNNKTAYMQWEDVGPFGEDDTAYVFGSNRPKEPRAGIDLSPAAAGYLDIDGRGTVNWRFVEESEVPPGPWKEVVTTSGIDY